jgi:hypothetical protein
MKIALEIAAKIASVNRKLAFRKFGKEIQQETINAYKVLGTLKLGILILSILLYYIY